MATSLSGKGLWVVTAAEAAQAIPQAPLMGVTHIMAKVGDTYRQNDGTLGAYYYPYATAVRQHISAAHLVPMAWIFVRLLYPEAEAGVLQRAFADGYQGVILDVEDQCAGKHEAAQRLVDKALQLGVDPYRVYNCSFPNIYTHSSLPYMTLNALCKGGLMPMSYAIFYLSTTSVSPAVQADTVIDEWTYGHYTQFFGALSDKPPIYPILGPFHEKPALRLLTAAQFQPWLDRLAAHEPTFFSVYRFETIRAGLYPLIQGFHLKEVAAGGPGVGSEIPAAVWARLLEGIVLRASPGGAPTGGAPYGRRMPVLAKTKAAGQNWYYARHVEGNAEGWVRTKHVTKKAPSPYPDPGPAEEFPPGWLKYVWLTADNINLRSNTDSSTLASLIGQVGPQTRLRLVDEEERRVGRARLGILGQWFHVQVEPGGPVGYISAAFVQAPPDLRAITPKVPEHYGVNLNVDPPSTNPQWPRAPHRLPTAEELQGVGWVRFVFRDSTLKDLTQEEAFAHYGRIVDDYRAAGINTLMILSWESYWGHGPWDHGDWPKYARDFAKYVRGVAQRFKGRVAAYQIWNEGDNPHNPSTSVYAPPETYAPILLQAGRAIEEVDPEALVVFGGVCGGAANNVQYIRQTRAAMQGEWPVDAVAVHPYGQYVAGDAQLPLSRFGMLHDYLAVVTQGLPGVPIWITEIGVPLDDWSRADNSNFYWAEIAEYLRGVYVEVEQHYRERVPVVFWFAWSNKMQGSGVVDTRDDPRGPIYQAFFHTVRG